MTRRNCLKIPLVCAAVITVVLALNALSADGDSSTSKDKLSKEVIAHQDGKARHWLVRSNGFIIEEHALTAHGDLPIVFEFPKGALSPQIDAPPESTNVEAVAKMFWRDGTLMSRTPMRGGLPNGEDFLWWPNGKLFREARFSMGKPVGLWKYYDKNGRPLGEGVFRDGKRQSGMFIGGNRSGYFFFFTAYPIVQQKFEDGALKEQTDFLNEPELNQK